MMILVRIGAMLTALLAIAVAIIRQVRTGDDGGFVLDTVFGLYPVSAAPGAAFWGPLLAADGLPVVGDFERWILALGLGAAAVTAVVFSGRGAATPPAAPAPAREPGRALAPYDPALAQQPRRRITDRGRGPIQLGIMASCAFFGGLTAWSVFAPLESAAVAPAVVKVETNRLTLEHPDGGAIQELLVKEGDQVKRGQVLLRLDKSQLTAERAVLLSRRDALLTLKARLEAERAGADAIAFAAPLRDRAAKDPALRSMMEDQNRLFRASTQTFRGEKEVGEQRIKQLSNQIKGLEAQHGAIEQQLAIIKDESADLEALLAKGLTPQTRVLALRRERARLIGSGGSLTAEIARTKAQIGETRLSLLQLERRRMTDTHDQLRSANTELLELAPRIHAVEQRLARTDLTAPASGAVFGLTKFSVGGVVRPGERILDIVPDDSELIVEARFSPVDRDVLNPGMTARVRLTAFSLRDAEPVTGELTLIGADARADDATGERYFTGVVAVSPKALADQSLVLAPGMPAEVVVPLAPRTPIQYLLEPLMRNWELALREE